MKAKKSITTFDLGSETGIVQFSILESFEGWSNPSTSTAVWLFSLSDLLGCRKVYIGSSANWVVDKQAITCFGLLWILRTIKEDKHTTKTTKRYNYVFQPILEIKLQNWDQSSKCSWVSSSCLFQRRPCMSKCWSLPQIYIPNPFKADPPSSLSPLILEWQSPLAGWLIIPQRSPWYGHFFDR